MPTKITYYALVNEYSSRERPGGVLRRIEDDEGEHDEAFTRDLEWKRSSSLYAYERGNMDNKFYEISEDEANQIVDRIRRTITGED
jgi:hypothetical protein